MRAIFTICILWACCNLAFSQTFNMSNRPINSCSGFFYDSGGPNGRYRVLERFTNVICPDGPPGSIIRLRFTDIELRAGDELCFYDGPDTDSPPLTCLDDVSGVDNLIIEATRDNPSGCITVSFRSNLFGNGDGWVAEISCLPNCQTILSDLVSTSPLVQPADTGWIDVCLGQEISFTGAGIYPENGDRYPQDDRQSSFSWAFGDGNVATGQSVSHAFEESGGFVVQLSIEDTLGCKNTNLISQRVRVAPQPDVLITGDTSSPVCLGDTLELLAATNRLNPNAMLSVLPGEGSFIRSKIRSDSLPLPDGDGASYTTSLFFNEFGPGQTLTNIDDLIDICVTMEHSYMFDLEISISCPNGQEVVLVDQVQIANETFLGAPFQTDDNNTPDPPGQGVGWEYCWTPNATNGTWTNYVTTFDPDTLPAGNYSSHQALDQLIGCPLNGEWTIRVTDLWERDNGWIFSWGIEFDPSLYPSAETFRPAIQQAHWLDNPDIFNDQDSLIAATPSVAGTALYEIEITDEYGCTYTDEVTRPVLPPTHPDCRDCAYDIPLPDSANVCQGESLQLDATINPVPYNGPSFFQAHPLQSIDNEQFPPSRSFRSSIAVNSLRRPILADARSRILSVCIDLEHSAAANLEFVLQSPSGQLMPLSTGRGGNGGGMENICFTSTAGQSILTATAPLSGDYRPEGNWSALNNSDLNGDWTLLVADNGNQVGSGFLRSWSIGFVNENEVTYSWSGGADLSCTDCPDPTVQPSAPTTYSLLINDDYNCQSNASIVVDWAGKLLPPVIDCGLSAPDAITFSWQPIAGASGYEVSLDGGNTWIPANGPLSHTVDGLTSITQVDIQVRGLTVGNLCEAEIGRSSCLFEGCQFTIDTFSTTHPSCHNTQDGSALLFNANANGDVRYFLNGNGPFSNSLVENIPAGQHLITAFDEIGCPASISFELIAPDPVQIILVADSVKCANESSGQIEAVVSGGTGAYQYSWSQIGAADNALLTSIPAGRYSLTVTDERACTAEATVDVGAPAPLRAFATATAARCTGDDTGQASAIASGGSPPYVYSWSNGNNGSLIDGLIAQDYEVTITDRNACTAVASATVDQPLSAVEAVVQQDVQGCAGANQNQASVAPSGGIPPYTILWSDGQIGLIASQLGDDLYGVTVSDANGCTFAASLNTTSLAPIEFDLVPIQPSCYGLADGSIQVVNVQGGSGNADPDNYTYLWDVAGAKELSEVSELEGNQTYGVTITDAQGCSASQSIELGSPDDIELSVVQTNVSCFNTTDGSLEVIASGGQGGFNYQWDAAAGGANTALVSRLGAGTYNVTVSDSAGCSKEASANLESTNPLTIAFEAVSPSCANLLDGQVNANASGGTPTYTYQWLNGTDGPQLETVGIGWHALEVTDDKGCILLDSFFLSGPDLLQASIQPQDPLCHDEPSGQIELVASGGQGPYRYSLNNGPFQSFSTFRNLPFGEYDIRIIDSEECSWEGSTSLANPPLFELSYQEEEEVSLGDSLQLLVTPINAVGTVGWVWEMPVDQSLRCPDSLLNCAAPWAKPLYSTVYQFFAFDDNGCEAEGRIQIRVNKDRSIYVPTGFTPNGDQVNDLLLVHGKESRVATIRYFRIFDRWGEMVFEARDFRPNDSSIGWNGEFDKRPMNPGVFVWVVEAEFEDGYREVYKGSSTLIR